MADEEETLEPDDLELDADVVEDEDADDLVGPELDEDLDADELVEVDDEFAEDDDLALVEEEDDDEAAAKAGPVRRSVGEEDDEDDDMLAPDDVEADLDTILKDRLVATEDEVNEDEEEPEERGEAADRLQPKRADEQLCPSCFLLVRQSAPNCPVGDDDCPLFRS
jgi:hypothetical protein